MTESREETSEKPAAEGPWLPAFAKTYPRKPELDRLVALFARGNHRAVREGAEKLVSDDDPEVAAAARDLLRRLSPDRIAYLLYGLTLLLLATLTAFAIHRSRELRQAPVPTAPRTVQTIVK